MKTELYRVRNNHIGLFVIVACLLMGILGLILLISLDGYQFSEISMSLLQYSIYTVYTQFGFFVLPIFGIYVITIDYKEKNISFYQLLGYDQCRYFVCKAFVLLIFNTVGNLLVALVVSALYGSFFTCLLFFMKIENVSVFITLISLFYGFVFKNIMVSYCVNFAVWVAGIVLYSVNSLFKVFCFYDATLPKHSLFQKALENGQVMDSSVWGELLYNIIITAFIMAAVALLRKRWTKNGI